MLGRLGRRRSPRSRRSARRGGPPARGWWRSAGRPASSPTAAAKRPPQPLGAARPPGSAPVPVANMPVRRDRRVVRAGDARHLAAEQPAGALEGVHADHARRAATCGRPARGRCGCARAARPPRRTRRFIPASRSAIGTPDLGRLLGAGHRHQPALALRDLVVAGAPRLRAVVAEAGDRQPITRPGLSSCSRVDGEAEPVEHADPEVLQQHVGPLDQRAPARPRRPGP